VHGEFYLKYSFKARITVIEYYIYRRDNFKKFPRNESELNPILEYRFEIRNNVFGKL